ncbi:hypothetical protein DK926_04700 [Rhodococcus sp. Eu-32]|uniref:hypothetical protein n=1 Tax=Rhodococcus sp. Eu-32 TaxID=1017319 RepID=UPI000DF3172F|nr:hypothetical protein [Rhodococcus sp. Eu-32]RRQ29186.1 hypothetical protein DK926_04700 [Rhodococcus sp. Eu-32]
MTHRPYVADTETRIPTSDELRNRIPGWGSDLDPADRPAYPRERFAPENTGAHWDFPEKQPELKPRERSIEHGELPPVFGTSAPLQGLSGVIRRQAFRYSEGRAAHWLMLLAGDRVDAAESHIRSLVSGRPDNPVTETGILSEFHNSRGKNRVDSSHTWMDPIVVSAPYVAAAAAIGLGVKKLRNK